MFASVAGQSWKKSIKGSKVTVSGVNRSKRKGQSSKPALPGAKDKELSTKQSSTARNGVSHDKIQPINQGSLNRDR
jgi:hypothetical protein